MSSTNKQKDDDKSEVSASYVAASSSIIPDTRHKIKINEIRQLDENVTPYTFLPLLIIVYYSFHYTIFYTFWVSIIFIYKGFVLPYPPQSLGPEIVGFFFFIIIQFYRLRLTSQGNKSEITFDLILSIFLSIPVLMGIIFLISYQTYVLVFDLGLNIFALIFTVVDIILTLIGLIRLNRLSNL